MDTKEGRRKITADFSEAIKGFVCLYMYYLKMLKNSYGTICFVLNNLSYKEIT